MNLQGEKWVWTTDDFEKMNWHDCYIHAFAFHSEERELILDIDYIFQWISPATGETYFRFLVSPATLVFENVYHIVFDLSSDGELQIGSMLRTEPNQPRNKDFIHKDLEWRWTIDCLYGSVSFISVGFNLYIRSAPQLGNGQKLDLHSRKGFSFLRGRYE